MSKEYANPSVELCNVSINLKFSKEQIIIIIA